MQLCILSVEKHKMFDYCARLNSTSEVTSSIEHFWNELLDLLNSTRYSTSYVNNYF